MSSYTWQIVTTGSDFDAKYKVLGDGALPRSAGGRIIAHP